MDSDAHALLRLHPAARGLCEEEIQDIAKLATVRAIQADEKVIEAGLMPTALSLVIGGRFRVEASSTEGVSSRVMNIGPGDQIGLLMLLHEEGSPVTILADEPSMTLDFRAADLFKLMQGYPLMARNLMRAATTGMYNEAVRQRLHPKPRTVAFLHTCSTARGVVGRIASRLRELGETVGVVTDDQSQSQNAFTFVSGDRIDHQLEETVRAKLADWHEMDRVFFDVDLHCNDIQWEQLSHLYSYSQQIFLVVSPDSALGQTEKLREVMDQASAWKHKLDLIWVLPEPVQVAPALGNFSSHANRDYKVIPAPESGMDFSVERVVHALRGVRIGIALGGGAARGMSHYGVLDVLEKANICIDEVAGCSVGAMLGVTYCSGYSVDFGIERYTEDLKLPWLYRRIRGGSKWYLFAKYRRSAWDAMLRVYLDDWRLEQLPIPIQTVGVDLVRGEEVFRTEGDAVHAVLESINLPYLSAPICRDGQALVDGGMLNVIPADALVRSGCNYVIAVNVSTRVKPSFVGNTPDTPTGKMKVPSVLQVWSRLLDVQARNLSHMGSAAADFTISPDVAGIDIGAFEETPMIAKLGEKAASASLTELKRQLHEIDAQLFPI
ncbi:MAG: patatin-like phospholipase family protein [Planctomycetota bacterium]